MRSVLITGLLGWLAVAWPAAASADDATRAEMAAALAEQADLHPAPLALPVASPLPAAAVRPVKRGAAVRPADAAGSAANAADHASRNARAQAAAQALAHQAAAAAAAAAGQARAEAARAKHRPPK